MQAVELGGSGRLIGKKSYLQRHFNAVSELHLISKLYLVVGLEAIQSRVRFELELARQDFLKRVNVELAIVD